MPYYQGDFYRRQIGDYYSRGDPGFFGSLFGGLATTAASFIPGGGAIARVAKGALGTLASRAKPVGAMIVKHPVLSAAGAAGAVGALGAVAGREMAPGVGMRGFHACKSKHGCKRGAFVRNRHMRVTNPRALRRALRRVGGFGRLASRVMRLTHPHRRGKMAFRFPKRRKAA